ncbi:MAG: DUF4330 domain-containing protein [Thermoleophilia bacterium]|nr:DUF4330 domain-containing protein [Thermoleophilia bacterium]
MSRFIDERGRIFGKVNVIDILVLLVIAAIVVLATVRFSDTKVDTVPVQVTYVVERARQVTVDALRAVVDPSTGAGALTNESGTSLGDVREFTITPTMEQVATDEGDLKLVESPLYSDVRIVVDGEGIVSGSTVRIGSTPLRIGQRATLAGMGFEVSATITELTWGAEVGR